MREELLPEYKCFVRLNENRLELCRVGKDGLPLATPRGHGWERVHHPVGQDFLDQVNKVFETKYRERDFYIDALHEKARTPGLYLK